MPLPERYQKQLMETMEAAEREAKRASRREWARVLGEIVLWTSLGLLCLGMAFHARDEGIGWVWWWTGHVVWVAGDLWAVISAYRRGEDRGDW